MACLRGFSNVSVSASGTSRTPTRTVDVRICASESTAFSRVHLWYMIPDEVKDKFLLNQYSEILSPSEKEYVYSMRGKELQKMALLARVLVRSTIARYQTDSKFTASSLKFKKNIHGKPEVEWWLDGNSAPNPVHFNISHSSSLMACGVTINSPIGIDVEEKGRRTKHNFLSLAKRYFSDHEGQVLSSIRNLQIQQQEFLKLWTLKEAYVKATGKGFSGAPFKTFTICVDSANPGSFHLSENLHHKASESLVDSFNNQSDTSSNWQFLLLELAGSHYAAICTEKNCITEGLSEPLKLTVWKTIPFLEDIDVSGSDEVVRISLLT